MTILTSPPALLNPTFKIYSNALQPKIQATKLSNKQENENLNLRRRGVLAATVGVVLGIKNGSPEAIAQSWGTRSRLWERFFGPELSPEESAERIRQTAEGLHNLREMLEHFSWRFVLTFIRLKKSYLSQDMKNALVLVPEALRKSYIDAANELVDNMSELDNYVRTPKIYESYLYYEKTLKSIDDLVALLA